MAVLLLCGCSRANEEPRVTRKTQFPRETATPQRPSAPVVFVFGDSYTAGTGDTPEERTYATETGRRLGWQVIVGGRAGSGFVSKGRYGQDFGTLYANQLAWRPAPDMVIVSGGHNDVGRPPDAVAAAAQRLLTDIRSRWPGTHLVLMGPMFGGDAPPAGVRIRDELRNVAATLRIPFIDPVQDRWITGNRRKGRGNAPKYILKDDTHLNPAGNHYIADRLAAKLRELGLAQPVLGRPAAKPPVTATPSVVAKP